MREFQNNPEERKPDLPIEWSVEGVSHFVETYGKIEGGTFEHPPVLRNLNCLLEVLTSAPNNSTDDPLRRWSLNIHTAHPPQGQPGGHDIRLDVWPLEKGLPGQTLAVAKIELLMMQRVRDEQQLPEDVVLSYLVIAPEEGEYFGLQKIDYGREIDDTEKIANKWVADENEVQALAELVQSAVLARQAEQEFVKKQVIY